MGDQAPVFLTEETVAMLRKRTVRTVKGEKVGCFLCRRILEALGPDRQLREWPVGDRDEQLRFPVESQEAHVRLEKGSAA